MYTDKAYMYSKWSTWTTFPDLFFSTVVFSGIDNRVGNRQQSRHHSERTRYYYSSGMVDFSESITEIFMIMELSIDYTCIYILF